jgi:energy-coupling factor transport system ATP-binding protein
MAGARTIPAAQPAGAVVGETVRVDDVTFTYLGGDRPALRGLGFAQARGQMIGVMGASGAGKSTLAKCLNRIVPEFESGELSGAIWIVGQSTDGLRVADVAGAVGMVFQDFESQLFSTNVVHEIAFALEQARMTRDEMAARIAPAIEAVGLTGFEQRDPTSLSGGQKQRLAIAAVLALRPSVIVFDEPTTDLDPEGRGEVFELIRSLRAQGLSLIVIEHEAEELRGCDHMLLMRDGSVFAEGAPAELMSRLELLEQCGVRPPGINEVLAKAGIGGHATNLDDAEASIRRAFPKLRDAHEIVSARLEAPPASSGSPLVEVQDLSFAYPEGPRVLDAINLRIHPGEFLAIIGQNGSGKTTLAKHIVGLLGPGRGRVLLDGRDRATLRASETAREAGYVFQNPDHQLFAPTVAEEVAFGPRNFGLAPEEVQRRSAEALHAVGLEQHLDSDPFLLSKGERQRLAVASVLALRPRLLILDEPTTGLDYREQRRMMSLVSELNRAGIAIVMITHTPWLVAEYARRVVLMRAGRVLFDGAVRELFADEALLNSSSFRAPEVTQLGRRFGVFALTSDELAKWLQEHA